MTYDKQTWTDNDPTTPLSAARLSHMEDGIDLIDAHEADTTAVHAASSISFTPTGTIAATNTQAAIVEVAAEASPPIIVQDEGVSLATPATTLNFLGAGVTVTGTGTTKSITIPGGGGGGGGGSGTPKDEIDARDYGIGPASSAAANAAAFAALISDIPKTPDFDTPAGLRVYLPSGVIDYSSPIDARGLTTVKWYGEGGKTSFSNTAATCLRYTGTGSSSAFLNGSGNGNTFEDIHFGYSSDTFTGALVDQTRAPASYDTALTSYRNCTFMGTTSAYSAATGVYCNSSHNTLFDNCVFALTSIGIKGCPDAGGDFSNSITVTNESLFIMVPIAIANVEEGLNVTGSVFEGTRLQVWNGVASIYRPLVRAYKDLRTGGGLAEGHNWSGNWFGDSNDVAENTVWLDINPAITPNPRWKGLSVTGNAFLTGISVIDFGGGFTNGVFLAGNTHGNPSASTYLNATSPDARNIYARGNDGMGNLGT